LATLRLFLVAVLIANFLAVFGFPNVGMHAGTGQWRGLLANKNIAGIVCATTILIFAFDGKKVAPPLRFGIILAAIIFLYQTWSRTPLIILPFAWALGFGISYLRLAPDRSRVFQNRATVVVSVIFGLGFLALIVLTLQRDFLISLTDDIGALSLRNAIWRPMLLFYLDHPILGAGYGSYWDAGIAQTSVDAYKAQRWLSAVDQGHNGYLDLLVQTGLPGLVLAVSAAIAWPLIRFVPVVVKDSKKASMIFSILFMIIVENFTESSMFSGDVFGNFLLFIVLAMLHRFELKSKKSNRNQLRLR
jgi:O-antigen ligase